MALEAAVRPVLQARRIASTEAEWADYAQLCLRHPLRALLHQDPFTYRAFSKPRGYSGDAVLLDLVQQVEAAHHCRERAEQHEEEFGVEIPDDAAEKIQTVNDAIEYIKKNTN